jgi:tyrosine-protein kinase Etk/Wzc
MAGESREFTVVNGGATTPAVPPAPPPQAPGQDDEVSLAYYLSVLWEGRWLIVGALALAAFGLVAYLATAERIYESDVLLQIEQRRPGGAQAFSDLPTALAGPQSQADTEIEVLQSRRLLGSVVHSLNLDVSVTPIYFPVIGWAWARRHGGPPSAAPWGLSRYAWGGESVTVSRFEVPEELRNGTVSVRLVTGNAGRFEVRSESGQVIAAGEVGQALKWNIAIPGGEGTATLFVQELRARPGTEFSLTKVSQARAVKQFRSTLKLSEKGRRTNVILVTMQGPDPAMLVTALDTLAQAYLRHNVERRSDEAQRTLQFLDTQIPTLRDELQVAETAFEQYRSRAGGVGVDLTAATKAILDRTVEMEKRLSEIELQRKELLFRFNPAHPSIRSVDEKVAQIRGERELLNEQIRRLPEAESASLRLMRDVKVANELYVMLLNKAQELKVMKSGLVGNAHVLDLAARAETPVSPNKSRSAAIAIAAGLLLGVVLAFASKALRHGLVDPADAERATGLIVRASVPHSDRQAALQREAKGTGNPSVLAAVDPTDMAAEAIRALRTSLQFALMEAPNRIIAIGGPRPGVGKSFITVNLARVFADTGKRVLLLDADLRKGSLHNYLGIHRTPGLAEVIGGEVSVADVLHKTQLPGIDFIPRGSSPSNPSELLGSERFKQVVEDLARSYDIVLVDLPPILAVTDAALVGRVAGVNLLVLRASWHPIRELQQAVKAYAENGVRLSGLVFNDVPQGKGGPGGYAYQYQYHYQYSYKPRDEK